MKTLLNKNSIKTLSIKTLSITFAIGAVLICGSPAYARNSYWNAQQPQAAPSQQARLNHLYANGMIDDNEFAMLSQRQAQRHQYRQHRQQFSQNGFGGYGCQPQYNRQAWGNGNGFGGYGYHQQCHHRSYNVNKAMGVVSLIKSMTY